MSADNKEVKESNTEAVCIELAGSKNENFLNPVTKEVLRGRWDRKNVAGFAIENLADLPDIPGLCIVVNYIKRRIRIFDPLAGEVNAASLALIKKVWKTIFKTDLHPYTAKVYTDCDNNTLKTISMWLRRHIDAGDAKVVNGRLPSFDEINKMEGHFNINTFDSSAESKKTMQRMPRPATSVFAEPGTQRVPEAVVEFDGDEDE